MDQDAREQFAKGFARIGLKHARWELWSDFATMTAIGIANAVEYNAHREEVYLRTIRKYTPEEQAMLAEITGCYFALVDADPWRDHLGDMYMRADLGIAQAGQFFTPYHLSRLMAGMQVDTAVARIEAEGWISASDPACGAGATLIALADALYQQGVNYQQTVFFAVQDINATTALMCYIQLSMLGCAGYVVIGDTLRQPDTAAAPNAPAGENVWRTPMYFDAAWATRRMAGGECAAQQSLSHLR